MSKQVTTVAGYLDEPRFGTTKGGKSYLQCSVPVKVETDRGQNNETIYTTYRYSFTLWNQKAEDFNARGVLVKGQYVMLSGTVKMTAYINDHPKNPADKGKPGINVEFLPGFELDLGMRPADAPPVVAKVWDNNNQNQGNNGGYNNGGGNSRYNNNRGGGGGNNYNNGGGNNYNRGNNGGGNGGYNNNYQRSAPPAQQEQAPVQPQQDNSGYGGNQYQNDYPASPYGE